MKKDVTTKPSRGDKTGSEIEIKRFSLIILWILLINSVSPQVPINGFCQIKFFPAFPGFTQLTVADINFDSVNDVLLYSTSQKVIAVIEGTDDNSLTDYKIINTPYQFSTITPVFNRETTSEQFFFSVRKKRIAGLFEFSKNGKIDLVAKIGFDSFPENISEADINNDGNMEFLISGSGFNGLSIIYYSKRELTEVKVEVNSSYSEAVFSDISNDGLPDIVAFNLLSNSIDVYYNDGNGGFENVRSFPNKSNIDNLKSMDLNRDFYDDIIYSTENSINILFGDFQSSYKSSLEINTKNVPNKYSIADFNNDSFLDFAYIDTTQGILSLIFGKGNKEYYPEVFYLIDKGITSLTQYNWENIKNLILINKKGKFDVISKMNSLPDDANIIPAIQPLTIASFDYRNNEVPDICYIDGYTHTINFLVSDLKGIPSNFYSASISDEHSSIFVDEIDAFRKGFYCYSRDGKMLEIIDFDFKKNKEESDQLYLPGKIKDLKINRVKDLVHVYVAYEKNKTITVGEYEHSDFRYNFRKYSPVGSDLIAPRLFLSKNPIVYFWQVDTNSVVFVRAKILSESIEYKQLGVLESKYFPIEYISQYLIDGKVFKSLNLINSKNNYFSVVSNDFMFNISNSVAQKNKFGFSKKDIFSPGKNNSRKILYGILYISEDHSFNRIEIKDDGRQLFFTKLFDAEEVTDFIVQKLLNNKDCLIYTQHMKGLLSLYRLK